MIKINNLYFTAWVMIFVLFSSAISYGETLGEVYRLAKEQDPKFKSAAHLYNASREIKKLL